MSDWESSRWWNVVGAIISWGFFSVVIYLVVAKVIPHENFGAGVAGIIIIGIWGIYFTWKIIAHPKMWWDLSVWIRTLLHSCIHCVAQYVLGPALTLRILRFRYNKRCHLDCRIRADILCDKCRSIIYKSSLITGTVWLNTPTSEQHEHLSWEELERSKESCHCCYLLWGSVRVSRSTTAIENPAAQPLLLRIWNTKRSEEELEDTITVWKNSRLRMQLEGDLIGSSNLLSVEEGEFSSMAVN
jgi:hypothetical protein